MAWHRGGWRLWALLGAALVASAGAASPTAPTPTPIPTPIPVPPDLSGRPLSQQVGALWFGANGSSESGLYLTVYDQDNGYRWVKVKTSPKSGSVAKSSLNVARTAALAANSSFTTAPNLTVIDVEVLSGEIIVDLEVVGFIGQLPEFTWRLHGPNGAPASKMLPPAPPAGWAPAVVLVPAQSTAQNPNRDVTLQITTSDTSVSAIQIRAYEPSYGRQATTVLVVAEQD